jgi:hypothetical protein
MTTALVANTEGASRRWKKTENIFSFPVGPFFVAPGVFSLDETHRQRQLSRNCLVPNCFGAGSLRCLPRQPRRKVIGR